MDRVERILEQWRRERPDLDVAAMGTIGRMTRLGAHLGHAMEANMARHGLNRASFDVLATLRRSGSSYALSPSELMDWTMVTSGTMTNRIDRLEEAGLVSRTRDPKDGRGSLVALTEKGYAIVDAAVGDHVANQQRLVAGLSEAERETLDALLAKWLSGFEPGQKGDVAGGSSPSD